MKVFDVKTLVTCILCHSSRGPPGGTAAWLSCLESTVGRRGRVRMAHRCGGHTGSGGAETVESGYPGRVLPPTDSEG